MPQWLNGERRLDDMASHGSIPIHHAWAALKLADAGQAKEK
jgi:hypothetical protein